MIIKKFFSAILVSIFFVNSPTFAQELSKEELIEQEIEKVTKTFEPEELPASLEARYFSFGANANLNTSKVNLNGGTVNLKSDLNLVNDHAAEIIFRYKNFSIDWLRMNKHGGGNFSAENNLTFGGENFSNEVSAKNNLHYIKLSVDNEIISLMGTGAYWTYGLAGIYWRGTVENSQKNYLIPVPTAGIGLYMAIMPKMTIYTQFSGMFMGGRGHLRDFETGLRYSPSKNFTLTAGFRSVEFNFNHKGNGDFKMNGPFLGLRSDF